MRYLVTFDYIDPGPVLPPKQLADLVENLVLPTFVTVAKLEKEKKVLAAGIPVAGRAMVMIVEAASHEELTGLLMGLPLWGIVKTDITPLDTVEGRTAIERKMLQQLKAMAK